MTQITDGLRSIFSNPLVYDGFQYLMGATRARRELTDQFIRPSPGMRILDIGCGTARIVDFFPNGVDYWGYDISARYIDAAKARFGTRGRFNCGIVDAAEIDRLPKFDVVIGIGLLHHLDDTEASGLFEQARRALSSDGRIVTVDPCFANGQNAVARFLISRDRGRNVRDADGYCALAQPYFSRIDGQIRHRSWIPYTHWIMECQS